MTQNTDIFDRHPEAGKRLADRIHAVLSDLPEELRATCELAEKPVRIGVNDAGTAVVTVDFREAGATLFEANFDGASVGLHAVAGELVYLP